MQARYRVSAAFVFGYAESASSVRVFAGYLRRAFNDVPQRSWSHALDHESPRPRNQPASFKVRASSYFFSSARSKQSDPHFFTRVCFVLRSLKNILSQRAQAGAAFFLLKPFTQA
jgi:hypothetical protein